MSGYTFNNPTLARSDYVGTAEHSPTIHNRGAVAHPEATTHDEDVEHIIFIGKFAESATAPRLMPSRYISLSPCSRLHYVCRQHGVTKTATAHAVVRRVLYSCNHLKTTDINRASGYSFYTPIRKRFPTLHHAPCRLKDVNSEA